jgi:thiosulfate dehydrogenase [quinone] large subunit
MVTLAEEDLAVMQYHSLLVPFMVILRLAMAWIFLWAGFDKLIGGFSAAGFLTRASSGPLHSLWVDLGQSAAALSVINPLVTWSQILMGFALFFGVATRFSLFWAGAMMFLFYLAQFPPEHDLFLDYYLVYILVYLMLGALGAGRILGLDKYIEEGPIVRKAPWLRYLLG